jgi:predicted Fe-Mo cluster-binding NifX family protein
LEYEDKEMITRVAVPVHNGRISPVFDVARKFIVAEMGNDGIGSSETVSIDAVYPTRRAAALKELGVSAVLCGAISRHMAVVLSSSDLEVIPFLSGTVDEVLNAYAGGNIDSGRFSMPGCRRRRRRFGGGRGTGRRRRESANESGDYF